MTSFTINALAKWQEKIEEYGKNINEVSVAKLHLPEARGSSLQQVQVIH